MPLYRGVHSSCLSAIWQESELLQDDVGASLRVDSVYKSANLVWSIYGGLSG